MRSRRLFQTIDTHTGGQPTRTIYGGVGPIPGNSVAEKMLYLKQNRDEIRQLLMFEPRGSDIMSGVILTEPCDPRADIGVIFIEVGGYLPMCGHDTVGVATALVEMAMPKEPVEPVTELTLDTPAGLVTVEVRVKDGAAESVTMTNVAAFVLYQDLQLHVPELGEVTLDISYGGNFYAIVRGADLGFAVERAEAREMIRVGNLIRRAVNSQVEVKHPELDFIQGLTHVQFYAPSESGAHFRNTVVIPDGSLDRSPCGTGTSARMASLFARGELALGEQFRHESIIGTEFQCRVLAETSVGGLPAIVPEVTGSAFVTGLHTFLLDAADPLSAGFQLLC